MNDQLNKAKGISIDCLHEFLAKFVTDYEEKLQSSISKVAGKDQKEVTQGALLEIQAKVQTWSTITSTASGIVRAVGDGLKAMVQNIR
ncbi:MAG: EscF/YscF/HrpA family type III secretion system needle major subunit [Puniceicoccales bacterium]|jgi:hypothetical protein|nr:EscF/YscF/HrpA family type III secretion system needle major subunit [Puniceicoccales bacterium]